MTIFIDISFKNRYNAILLFNGLPLVQIELECRGIEIKEAFNQMIRDQLDLFWSNHGLFQYVQLFVNSNGDCVFFCLVIEVHTLLKIP